jgi:microsomal dipeptidase-like Zn-dependent dipeptidase
MSTLTLELPNRDTMDKKVSVIKAIRALTGFSLREAKNIADDLQEGKTGLMTSFHINDNHDTNHEHLETFKEQGVVIIQKTTVNEYVRDVRNLSIRAIKNSDYSVAQDVLDLLKKLDSSGV